MKKIILFEYLPILNSNQIEELIEFAQLKRFKLKPREITLLNVAIHEFKLNGKQNLTKDFLTHKVSMKDSEWSVSLKKLLSLIRSYIHFIQLEADSIEANFQRGVFFKSKAQYHLAKKEFDEGLQKNEKQNRRGIQYYFNKFKLYFNLYDISGHFNNNILLGGFREMVENLDRLYSLCKLLISCEVKSMKGFQVDSIEVWNEKAVDQVAEELQSKDKNPLFTFFANLKRLRELANQEVQEEYTLSLFEWLVHSFKLNYYLMENQKEGMQAFINLINFSISQERKGPGEYLAKRFELLVFGLEKGITVVRGKISETSFWNIIFAAIRLERYSEARDLLEHQSAQIDFKNSENSFKSFCEAFILFGEKKFEETLKIIIHCNNLITPVPKLLIRILELKCNYEQSLKNETYLALLVNQIDNFKRSLKTSKDHSANVKQNVLNFIRMLRKIVWAKVRLNFSPHKKEKWLAELENYKNINSKEWLRDILSR